MGLGIPVGARMVNRSYLSIVHSYLRIRSAARASLAPLPFWYSAQCCDTTVATASAYYRRQQLRCVGMGDYERLNVWKKAHALTCDVYRVTSVLPSRHYWPLGDQMRRASLSIGTNIAEGCGRNHVGHFRNSLTVSLGEANELHYLLLVAHDVEVLKAEIALSMRARADEVRRMLSGLLESVRQRGRIERSGR